MRTYTLVAIWLHWLIAIIIVGQVLLAWYMGSLEDADPIRRQIMVLHFSIGLSILILSVLRLAWRLTHKPPALPAGLAGWEKALARASHGLFYVFMLGIPILGWALVSVRGHGKSIPFLGARIWPAIPGLGGLPHDLAHQLGDVLETVHGTVMVYAMVALLALHVAGALKHQFDSNRVLYRMLPFLSNCSRGWQKGLAVGLGI